MLEVWESHDIGSKPLTFVAILSHDEAVAVIEESLRIFMLQFVEWDAETGQAKIKLVPHRGIIEVKGKNDA